MIESPGRTTTSVSIDQNVAAVLAFYCDGFKPKKNRSRFIERLLREYFSKDDVVRELQEMGWPEESASRKQSP